MTDKEELQKLKQKRKEIDEQIQQLMRKKVQFGRVKIDKDHYPSVRADEWYIAVKCILPDPFHEGEKQRDIWRAIIRNTDKLGALEELHEVIADLVKLEVELKNGDQE